MCAKIVIPKSQTLLKKCAAPKVMTMAKPKTTKDLKKYSKDDLIWIINRMSSFGQGWYLNEALRELEHQKELDAIREAERVSALANKYRQEYIDLLMPYDGKPWSEIPIATLQKAEQAMKKARSYDKQYCKLMGI